MDLNLNEKILLKQRSHTSYSWTAQSLETKYPVDLQLAHFPVEMPSMMTVKPKVFLPE